MLNKRNLFMFAAALSCTFIVFDSFGDRTQFDPKVPFLKDESVARFFDKDVMADFLEKDFPKSPEHVKSMKEVITPLAMKGLLWKFDKLLENPELPEVTRIRLSWFKTYRGMLAKCESIAGKIEYGVITKKAEEYKAAVNELDVQRKACIKYYKGRRDMLTKAERDALLKKNIPWRIAEYRKMEAERQKQAQLEAAKKAASGAKAEVQKKTGDDKKDSSKNKKKKRSKRTKKTKSS